MTLAELEKLLYGIAMDSVFMSRPDNGMMINSMLSELQNIQNASNALRGDMTNDSFKATMNSKLAELENVFIMTASQRLSERGISVMAYGQQQPQMQQSMQNPYGQPQNPYGQQMQNPYGQQPQNPYGQQMPQYNYQQQPMQPQMQQPPIQQPQAAPQPAAMPAPQPQHAAPVHQEPVHAPKPTSSGPIAYDDEPVKVSAKRDDKPVVSSGGGAFGMDGGSLPGAKKSNEPAGSAAGRDFLLSLLDGNGNN